MAVSMRRPSKPAFLTLAHAGWILSILLALTVLRASAQERDRHERGTELRIRVHVVRVVATPHPHREKDGLNGVSFNLPSNGSVMNESEEVRTLTPAETLAFGLGGQRAAVLQTRTIVLP